MTKGDLFEVESILDCKQRRRGGRRNYLIKWKNYPESQNTWEPEANIPKTLRDVFWDERNRSSTSKSHKKRARRGSLDSSQPASEAKVPKVEMQLEASLPAEEETGGSIIEESDEILEEYSVEEVSVTNDKARWSPSESSESMSEDRSPSAQRRSGSSQRTPSAQRSPSVQRSPSAQRSPSPKMASLPSKQMSTDRTVPALRAKIRATISWLRRSAANIVGAPSSA